MHRSGFVNIVGNPNVGKSTLMNALVGERLSIITSKAQTTRHRIMGIVNGDDFQIVYSDTPGVLKPNYKLQEQMLEFSNSALVDADILLYVTDVLVSFWHKELPDAEIYPISAQESFGVEDLFERIKDLLPECPPYFDKDQMTDKPAKFFVTEIIREKILQNYEKEIPYSVEVEVESFKEEDHLIRINAVIYVERDSQKGIIIGKQGKALKKVGTEARMDIETFFDKKVFLQLFVKVDKDWRQKSGRLKHYGYDLN